MEPVTYLLGLSMVICGYVWFVSAPASQLTHTPDARTRQGSCTQGHKVSCSTVSDQSISTCHEALYAQRGFDIER